MPFSSMTFLKPATSLIFHNYTPWKNQFEEFIMFHTPELGIFFTERYERPRMVDPGFGDVVCKPRKLMSDEEIMNFNEDKKATEILISCIPKSTHHLFKSVETTYDLWAEIAIVFGRTEVKSKSSDDGITEKLLKKEEEIQELQSRILKMENEREQMCSKIIELQVDHDLVIETVEALREQCDKVSQSHIPPVEKKKEEKKKEKKKKKKSVKRMSQFTTYSLQKNKNKKYSENSPSTKQSFHHMVDRCVYTRAQMFALVPPRCHRMVQRRWKNYVPFSSRKYWLPPVPRTEFRYETSRFNFRWNSMSLDYLDDSYKRLSKISSKIGTVLKWVPKAVV